MFLERSRTQQLFSRRGRGGEFTPKGSVWACFYIISQRWSVGGEKAVPISVCLAKSSSQAEMTRQLSVPTTKKTMDGNCSVFWRDHSSLPRAEEDCGSRPVKGLTGVLRVSVATKSLQSPLHVSHLKSWSHDIISKNSCEQRLFIALVHVYQAMKSLAWKCLTIHYQQDQDLVNSHIWLYIDIIIQASSVNG